MEQEELFESIFQRQSGVPGNKDFLEKIVLEHPYFTPAQFFLLKLITPGTNEHNWQAAKTSILFNDPLWLNFQLQHGNGIEENRKRVLLKESALLPIAEDKNLKPGLEPDLPGLNIKFPVADDVIDNGLPIFEPQYTRDYFASQGIKLNEEINPTDKLGKQLKSFTDWLKTMKKVHVDKISEASQQTEMVIQTLAEKSNREEEILTESMAEVFSKQGKTGKAIELYQKLSLLNPSKIAYFAAKIERLKNPE